MLTTIVVVLQLVRGASSLGCYGFEAYSECGEPQKEFRMESGDQPCDAATMSAGYCVCTSTGCDDPANYIRIEMHCAQRWDSAAPVDMGRNCSTVCEKHKSTSWIKGVAAGVGASLSTASGLIIQKKAQLHHQRLAENQRPPEVLGFIMSPMWMLGFLLLVILPLPFNLMAVTWAAASLVAPLASVTLVLNQVLAPCTLNEKLTRLDVVATLVIVVGVVLASVFGTHCESSYTPQDLMNLYLELPFLMFVAVTLPMVGVALSFIRRWRKEILGKFGEHLSTKDMQALGAAPTAVCVSYAFLAGYFGAVMQIIFKGVGELVGAGAFDHFALWLFIPLVAVLATAQMSFLNKGMEVCDAIKLFPAYNAALIVMMCISGMLYYEEYKQLGGLQVWLCFGSGVLLVIIGVLLLTMRSAAEGPASTIRPLEQQQRPPPPPQLQLPKPQPLPPPSPPPPPDCKLPSEMGPLGPPVEESKGSSSGGPAVGEVMGAAEPRPPQLPTPKAGPLLPLALAPVSAAAAGTASTQVGAGDDDAGSLAVIEAGWANSMTPEDAAAFLKLSVDQRSRLGALSQEELMAEVARKLVDGGEEEPLLAPPPQQQQQ